MSRSFKALVRGYQDQTLTEEEVRDLDQRLKTDPDARHLFLRESNLIAGLEEIASDEVVDSDSFPVSESESNSPGGDRSRRRSPTRITTAAGWWVAAVAAALLLATHFSTFRTTVPSIATIVGLSGPLQWTGDGGALQTNLSVGMKLPGGTIDGLSPESWFALEFNDGSNVVISGNSMLAYSDLGQKVLHLKSGNLFADVNPQPVNAPMLIHTRSAVLEVLGTSFEIDADLASTALNVTEGKVRVKRRSDGRRVVVPAQHQVVAAADQDLSVNEVPQVAHHWKSRLQDGPRRTYGRWLPAVEDAGPLLHCIPYTVEDGRTIFTSSFQVTTADAATVMTSEQTSLRVRGRLDEPADLFVGMSLKTAQGDFAGRFQVVVPQHDFRPGGRFDITLPAKDFQLDPSLAGIKSRLPESPDDLIVESIWCHTLYQPAGLAVASVELTERSE